ncbi:MAG: Rpn family recombination-promoting nuclease/putative transposase [Oscillospiraceae bacterium]|jgi:predicted transposase/invertase (TIGR01784 family)|nr:Rpn family recombination-promoting nuclease/putative transposase [Oscillospiraceae bacterium]
MADNGTANANREHKSSVFADFFKDRDRLLEMYGALKGISYPADTQIELVTLEDVLFQNQINDLAFVLDGRLIVLVEHQSTLNNNIPLRMLIYIGREYERLTDSRDIYRHKLLKIPKPDFIVLYNGTEECPDEFELKLSDAFTEAPEIPDMLELKVKGYNVNDGHNPEILQRSRNMGDYAKFIALIRKKQETGMALSEAITAAIRQCIDKGIMADYLKKQGSEVENMLMTEFNIDVAKEVWMEEARQDGIEIGEARGEARGETRGKRATALAMIKGGIPIETASKYSGIPVDELRRHIKASGASQLPPQ